MVMVILFKKKGKSTEKRYSPIKLNKKIKYRLCVYLYAINTSVESLSCNVNDQNDNNHKKVMLLEFILLSFLFL